MNHREDWYTMEFDKVGLHIASAVLVASTLAPMTNGKIKHSFGDYHIIAIEQFPDMERHTEPPTYRVTHQEGVRAANTTATSRDTSSLNVVPLPQYIDDPNAMRMVKITRYH